MAFPRYKNCCLCTNVKTGAIILAMIGLLAGGLFVFLDSVAVVYVREQIDRTKVNKTIEFMVSNHGFLARMNDLNIEKILQYVSKISFCGQSYTSQVCTIVSVRLWNFKDGGS